MPTDTLQEPRCGIYIENIVFFARSTFVSFWDLVCCSNSIVLLLLFDCFVCFCWLVLVLFYVIAVVVVNLLVLFVFVLVVLFLGPCVCVF